MKNEAVVDTAVETAARIGKGYLNGTTRGQAYGILAVTALTGLASGVAATTYYVKSRFVLKPKLVKVENPDIPSVD